MARRSLHPGTSLYLDLARISAAALVLLNHVFEPPFYDGGLNFPGPSAVVTFFVIWDFVIAYATDSVSDWRIYAVARFARMHSVVLPALALTAALYFLGQALSPGCGWRRRCCSSTRCGT